MEFPDEDSRRIWEEMMSGRKYFDAHPFLLEQLRQSRALVRQYNDLPPEREAEMSALLHDILGHCGTNPRINQPFHCDYGCNIRVGDNFFANFNLTILDEGLVTIGDNAFIGPNVSIYTACHPLEAAERNASIQWSRPVTIGNDVWIGGNVTILPGVTIGDGCVIGAGAVVTGPVPSHTLAVGNPARVIRNLPA